MLARQHDMCVVSLDTDFVKLPDDRALLRTRIRIVVDLSARSISNKENCNPGLQCGSYEPGYAGYRTRIVRLVIVVHLLVGEGSLEGQLKISAADNGLVDVEDNCGWKTLSVILPRQRGPGLVVDESG